VTAGDSGRRPVWPAREGRGLCACGRRSRTRRVPLARPHVRGAIGRELRPSATAIAEPDSSARTPDTRSDRSGPHVDVEGSRRTRRQAAGVLLDLVLRPRRDVEGDPRHGGADSWRTTTRACDLADQDQPRGAPPLHPASSRGAGAADHVHRHEPGPAERVAAPERHRAAAADARAWVVDSTSAAAAFESVSPRPSVSPAPSTGTGTPTRRGSPLDAVGDGVAGRAAPATRRQPAAARRTAGRAAASPPPARRAENGHDERHALAMSHRQGRRGRHGAARPP